MMRLDYYYFSGSSLIEAQKKLKNWVAKEINVDHIINIETTKKAGLVETFVITVWYKK